MTQAPRVRFVIGGVQKGGTTALASFMRRNPAIVLPFDKEAHVFDAPNFDESWDVAAVDRHYRRHFPDPVAGSVLHGDATPIYCLHPVFVARIARYNPAMRWILILRHPADRALSHYRMERDRGNEAWPLWPALLLERWRLRGGRNDLSAGSAMRRYSYRTRGDYARQLRALYTHFPASQVLVLRNEELAAQPAATLERVYRFLGVPPAGLDAEFERVFQSPHVPWRRGSLQWRALSLLMRHEIASARDQYGIHWDP